MEPQRNVEYGEYICNAQSNEASSIVMYAAAGFAFLASGYLGYLMAPYARDPKPENTTLLFMGSGLGIAAFLAGVFAIISARREAGRQKTCFYEMGILHGSGESTRFIRFESLKSLNLKVLSTLPLGVMILLLGLIGHQMAKYCGRVQLQLDDGSLLEFKVTKKDVKRIAQAATQIQTPYKLKLTNVEF